MKSSYSGTIFSGAVRLDEIVDLADQSRVHVTIVPIEEISRNWQKPLAALDELRATHPIRLNGLKFTREQLHERD